MGWDPAAWRDAGVALSELDGPVVQAIWEAAGVGDDQAVRDLLEGVGIYFTEPGTEGAVDYEGAVDLKVARVPDDILGQVMLLTFRAATPLEVWRETRTWYGPGLARVAER